MSAKRSRISRGQASTLTLIRKIWKQKIQIVTMSAVLTAAASAVLYFWPDTYKAEALILVDVQKIPEKFVTATVSAELQDRLATISQQILSSTRLQKIIDTFHLYEKERKTHVQEEILEMMKGDIAVTVEKGWTQNRPGAFRIAYRGKSPQMVADVTNQLANLFVEENLRTREVQAEGTSEFFRSQLAEAKKALDEQEAKVSKYKLQFNGQLPEQETALAATLNRLQIELEGNQDALNRLQQNKTMAETALSAAQTTQSALVRMAGQLGPRNGGTSEASSPNDLLRERERLEVQLAQMLLRYREDHPDIVAIRAAINHVKERETKAQTAAKPEPPAAPQAPSDAPPEMMRALSQERERVATLNAQLKVINNDLEVRHKDRERILAEIARYQSRIESLPVRQQQMAAMTRDYEVSKAHYHSLLDKIFAADMAADMERRQKAERFTILDPARVPEKPVAPNRPLFGAAGCIVALALSLGIALLIETKKNLFLGEWELPANFAVLGRVPVIQTGLAPGRQMKAAVIGGAAATCVAVIGALLYWARG